MCNTRRDDSVTPPGSERAPLGSSKLQNYAHRSQRGGCAGAPRAGSRPIGARRRRRSPAGGPPASAA
eukprot:724282-Prorocentrum_minimum.AAC.1